MLNENLIPQPKPAEIINKINLDDLQQRLKTAGIDFAEKIDKLPIPPKGSIYGIDEIKDVVVFGIYVIKAFVLKDTNPLARWLSVVTALPSAIIGISDVPLELKDLDEEELNELVEFVKSLLPELNDQNALLLIEHSMKVAWGLFNIVNLIQELRNDKENK